MKKTYFSPETIAISVEAHQLMSESPTVLGYDNGIISQDLAGAGETGASSGNLSRRNNVWDEWDF